MAVKGGIGIFIFLATGMLISGTLNTITTKYADLQEAPGVDPTPHEFNHPFFQALAMFLGEVLCLFAFYASKLRAKYSGLEMPDQGQPFSPTIFIVPALLDFTGTSVMYVALTLTLTSVYQMLRGSVVIFTGLLTVTLLKKPLARYQWAGMVLVLFGLALVGLASILGHGKGNDAKNPLLGDILILVAQIFVGLQMVYEEKFVGKYNVPALLAVGLEGLFGIMITCVVLFVMYWIPGNSAGNHFENSIDALKQMGNKLSILGFTLGSVLSIAFFNYFGVSVTKRLSATTRMVLDSLRNVLVWAFSMSVGWEHWNNYTYMQIAGFLWLLGGTAVYNKLIPLGPRFDPPKTDAEGRLLGADGNRELGAPDEEERGYLREDTEPINSRRSDRHQDDYT